MGQPLGTQSRAGKEGEWAWDRGRKENNQHSLPLPTSRLQSWFLLKCCRFSAKTGDCPEAQFSS